MCLCGLQVTETRSRGDLVGELSFFFRLRHLHTACVGRTMATVFMLPYNDYKQLAATYVDDDTAILVSLANSVQPTTSQPPLSRTRNRETGRERPAHVIQKVEQAMERRTKQHVVKLLHAVAENDLQLVKDMIDSGKVLVRSFAVFHVLSDIQTGDDVVFWPARSTHGLVHMARHPLLQQRWVHRPF